MSELNTTYNENPSYEIRTPGIHLKLTQRSNHNEVEILLESIPVINSKGSNLF